MTMPLLWQRLESQLQRLVSEFSGVAGVAIQELTTGLTLGINADEVFPTASTIKIHVLVQLLTRAEAGELDLQQRIAVSPEGHVLGSGVLAYLDGPVALTLRDLAILPDREAARRAAGTSAGRRSAAENSSASRTVASGM